jgi:flagellar basal-body rod modification protein FlgD
MSTVNAVGTNYVDQSSNNMTSSTASSQQIGESEFLNLLVTQLKNQDPMNPMDNSEFITQMASFNSLEQLISINQAVSKIADASQATGDTGNKSGISI